MDDFLGGFSDGFEPVDFNLLTSKTGVVRDLIHKDGWLTQGLRDLAQAWQQIFSPSRYPVLLENLMLRIMGKRNIRKSLVLPSELSPQEFRLYRYIVTQFQNPLRKQRVYDFLHQPENTKRLISYFIVDYIYNENQISYYLDRSVYPRRILGKFNQPNDPIVLRQKELNPQIEWINLHQQYKMSKNRDGRKHFHAPYGRSNFVADPQLEGLECLCVDIFYLWLDDMAGFEVYRHFEDDIREKKVAHDRRKIKKRKIMRDSNGQNYTTVCLNYKTTGPYQPQAFLQAPLTSSVKLSNKKIKL